MFSVQINKTCPVIISSPHINYVLQGCKSRPVCFLVVFLFTSGSITPFGHGRQTLLVLRSGRVIPGNAQHSRKPFNKQRRERSPVDVRKQSACSGEASSPLKGVVEEGF